MTFVGNFIFAYKLHMRDTDLSKYFTQITWSLIQWWNIIAIIVCRTMGGVAEDALAKKE